MPGVLGLRVWGLVLPVAKLRTNSLPFQTKHATPLRKLPAQDRGSRFGALVPPADGAFLNIFESLNPKPYTQDQVLLRFRVEALPRTTALFSLAETASQRVSTTAEHSLVEKSSQTTAVLAVA